MRTQAELEAALRQAEQMHECWLQIYRHESYRAKEVDLFTKVTPARLNYHAMKQRVAVLRWCLGLAEELQGPVEEEQP